MVDFAAWPGPLILSAAGLPGADEATQYHLLAIRVTCSEAGRSSGFAFGPGFGTAGSSPFDRIQLRAKDTYLLTADRDGIFRWVAGECSRLSSTEAATAHPPEGRRRLTRYSLEEDVEENAGMIYPLRPFSITAVELEGFDPARAYAVLAIDVDKFLPDVEVEEAGPPQGPQPETMALFLVGNDGGEFVWVGEDQCRLFPIE